MFRPDLNWVRLGMMSLAGILGLGAAWILAVQFIRPTVPFFPDDAASSQAAAAYRGAAGAAAWIGFIRGDLWTDYAITLAPDLSKEFTGDPLATSLQARKSVQAAAVRAVELAPFEARSWLLLADVNSRALDHKVTGFLKMSYYTGPNALSLIPMRINIATRTDAISDPELQILVVGEIRTIITRRPDLKALILATYRNATPEGRRFIEAQVAELDTGLLASLRATNTSR